jgi:hypothetical protein
VNSQVESEAPFMADSLGGGRREEKCREEHLGRINATNRRKPLNQAIISVQRREKC